MQGPTELVNRLECSAAFSDPMRYRRDSILSVSFSACFLFGSVVSCWNCVSVTLCFGAAVSCMDLPAGVSEEAALKYLSTDIDAELAHILQEAGVPLGLQYRLTQSFKTVRRFQSYEDNRAGIRDALKTDFSLEPNTLEKRAGISAVISAWEACQQFAAKEQELRAEARVLGVARPVTQTDRSAMRAAYEATHGRLEEAHEPSEDYISCKMEELNLLPRRSPRLPLARRPKLRVSRLPLIHQVTSALFVQRSRELFLRERRSYALC